jgi:uncharacterized protein YjbI with pentapeptide repeats
MWFIESNCAFADFTKAVLSREDADWSQVNLEPYLPNPGQVAVYAPEAVETMAKLST